MRTVLMVAEKPSIAESIAKALCRGALNKPRHGKTPIYEFEGELQRQPCLFKVTAVTGHMFSCDFPPEYANWDAVDPKDLFQAPTMKKLESGGVFKQLQSEAKNADALVLWLDCDREGENICFEVIDCVKSKMKKQPNGDILVLRAKFSAVNKPDIQKAMATLTTPNENESLSVDARQELDLKVGVAFSRFQTRYFQGRYGDLDSSLVSYGPCQTPTLGFCVDRHDEIQQFQPESFWALDVEITKENHTLKLEWDRARLFDHEAVCTFRDLVQEAGVVQVVNVKKSETSRSRPTPLNTVNMLQLASKTLSMGPYTAMQVAERLYLQGFISYPRTESTSYPESYDIRGTLAQHANNAYWGSHVQALLQEGFQRPKKGVDVGDHPPITPVRSVQPTDLTGDMARLYDLIARYFIATVSPDAKLLATKVQFRCGSEKFSLSGHQVIRKGFTEVLTSTSLQDNLLPSFDVDETFAIASLKVRNGQTSPPSHLTESELIGLMEQKGIGTDASIPAHINNICERNYVTLGSGRTLVPTNLGIVLVHGYYKTDPELVLPKVRAQIEQQCTLIAQGLASKASVLSHSLTIFQSKFEYFVRKIALMDSLFEATFSPLAATGKPLSKCGKCSRYMKYIHLKPQRLHCANCNETYQLPQNGTIKLYKELRCPMDQFEMVLFSLGNQEKAMGKSYPLCPYCYNYPPFEEIVDKMGCDSCLHPTCKHSLVRNGICPCPGADAVEQPASVNPRHSNHHRHQRHQHQPAAASPAAEVPAAECPGTMVLDVNSKPNWKLACNKCNLLIHFQNAVIHQITPVKDSVCDQCGARELEVEFHKDKSPLPDSTSYVGCVLCDDLLTNLTHLKKGRMKHVALRKNAGRGRGRRGRRGGGPRKLKGGLLAPEDF